MARYKFQVNITTGGDAALAARIVAAVETQIGPAPAGATAAQRMRRAEESLEDRIVAALRHAEVNQPLEAERTTRVTALKTAISA